MQAFSPWSRTSGSAGGVVLLVLALAAEGGRGFPVAKRAAAEANLAGGLLEEDARTRRLDKSRRGRLAAFWLASGPADSATIDSSPAGFLRRRAWAKHAICEVSGRVLQSSCLQSGRGWGDNSRVLRRAVRTTSRRKDGFGRKAPCLRQQKQSRTPRLRVGRGRGTDLVFPDASDRRRKRGGGA